MGFQTVFCSWTLNTTTFQLHVYVSGHNTSVSSFNFTYSMILVLGSNGVIELSPNLSITWSQEQSHLQIIQIIAWLFRVVG